MVYKKNIIIPETQKVFDTYWLLLFLEESAAQGRQVTSAVCSQTGTVLGFRIPHS